MLQFKNEIPAINNHLVLFQSRQIGHSYSVTIHYFRRKKSKSFTALLKAGLFQGTKQDIVQFFNERYLLVYFWIAYNECFLTIPEKKFLLFQKRNIKCLSCLAGRLYIFIPCNFFYFTIFLEFNCLVLEKLNKKLFLLYSIQVM